MKIETDGEYKLFAKLAYHLSFTVPSMENIDFFQMLLNVVTDAIDAYDVEHGYVMYEPPQELIDEHERDMSNEKNSNI